MPPSFVSLIPESGEFWEPIQEHKSWAFGFPSVVQSLDSDSFSFLPFEILYVYHPVFGTLCEGALFQDCQLAGERKHPVYTPYDTLV